MTAVLYTYNTRFTMKILCSFLKQVCILYTLNISYVIQTSIKISTHRFLLLLQSFIFLSVLFL